MQLGRLDCTVDLCDICMVIGHVYRSQVFSKEVDVYKQVRPSLHALRPAYGVHSDIICRVI